MGQWVGGCVTSRTITAATEPEPPSSARAEHEENNHQQPVIPGKCICFSLCSPARSCDKHWGYLSSCHKCLCIITIIGKSEWPSSRNTPSGSSSRSLDIDRILSLRQFRKHSRCCSPSSAIEGWCFSGVNFF